MLIWMMKMIEKPLDHEWARWARRQRTNLSIEKQLMAKLNGDV